jgi:putative membrane protein
MFLIIRFIITLMAVWFIWSYVPGFEIKDQTDAVLFSLILSAINAVIRPLIIFLTLPITVATLGLFTLVINFGTFFLASEISYGVHFHTFSALFWGSFCMWITSLLTNRFIWRVNIY